MHRHERVPTLGELAEQTRSSWAKRLATWADVPLAYRGFFEPLRAAGQDMPYAILTPSYSAFLRQTAQKVICLLGDEVYVVESNDTTSEARCFPLAEIGHLQFRTVLLDSHLYIWGLTKQRVPADCTLRFNTVTDYLFWPIVHRIRQAAGSTGHAVPSTKRETFDHLARVNDKFMNFARKSLLPGETVVCSILQPEIRQEVLPLLGKIYTRTLSPTHMSILTDRDLILIREERRHGTDDRYGGIWDYVPVTKIAALSVDARDEKRLSLSVQLPAGDSLNLLFEASAGPDVDHLLDCAGQIAGIRTKRPSGSSPAPWSELLP